MQNRIIIDREKLSQHMAKQEIESLEQLVIELRAHIPRCSYPTVMRWNAQGWPQWEYDRLCDMLDTQTLEYVLTPAQTNV